MNNPIQKSDKESYIFLCQNEATIPLFMQPDWLDVVCGNELVWNVVLSKNREGVVDAVLVFCLKKKYGITQITMPHFTQFTGFWFLEKLSQDIDNQQVVINMLLEKLPKIIRTNLRFHYNFSNNKLLLNQNFEVENKQTQVLENLQNLDFLYQNLSQNVQRNIKKANQYFRVEIIDNFDLFYPIINTVFERQNKTNPIPLSIWQSVHTFIHQKECGKVYFSMDENNEAHAAVMVVWDANTMYLLANGSTEKGRKLSAMTQLIWHVITENAGNVDTFNFFGSSIPAIQEFNLRFNAENKTYFSVMKYQNKIVEKLFRFIKR
jgi:Acetyltransferase (GNAT) domain